MSKSKKTTEPVNPNPDWQDSDIHIPAAIGSVVFVLLTAAATFVGSAYLLKYYDARDKVQNVSSSPHANEDRARELPPEPMLQINEPEDLAEHRAYENEYLHHYAWAGDEEGIVRIPIDRAKQLVLERGLPVRDESGRGEP